MKFITQNLHCFAEENYLEKMERIAQFIVDNSVDIACFQEVAQPTENVFVDENMHIREGNAALLIRDMILSRGGDAYEVFYSFAHYYYGEDEEGVAILSRLPIKSWREHVISQEQEFVAERRTAMEVQLETGVSITSLHLGIATTRNPQSPAVEQFLDLRTKTKGELQLYLGDYNIPDTTDGYDQIIESGCIDLCGEVSRGDEAFLTTPGAIDGWMNQKGAKRLDYGFANQAVEVKSACVIFDGKKNAVVSDHFGLYFDLAL